MEEKDNIKVIPLFIQVGKSSQLIKKKPHCMHRRKKKLKAIIHTLALTHTFRVLMKQSWLNATCIVVERNV